MDALKAIALPPGFGFHPTDVELISHYLKRKNSGQKADFEVIPELDIYKREPWDLPACCQIPTRDSKWHFFTSRDRKYPNGTRSNRATEAGYWKSTGKDRKIRFHNRVIGTKKTLVFHQGRPPYGKRTDWIMHEYFMDEKESKKTTGMKDTYVLCRITKRNGFEAEGENTTAQIDGSQKASKDLDASMNEGVEQEESSLSESAEDLDSWFKELFDPNFDGSIDFSCAGLPASIETQTGLSHWTMASSQIPKEEPLDYGFLPEEIIGILRDDLTAMPEITELLNVNQSSAMARHHQLTNFNSQDFKEMPDLPEIVNFTGIQIRTRNERPAPEPFLHHVKLQVQTSKMESRNTESVCQTFKCAQVDRCISSSKLEVDKKIPSKSNREAKQNCAQGILNACMIGTVALIICFLFRDYLRIFGNFPSLSL